MATQIGSDKYSYYYRTNSNTPDTLDGDWRWFYRVELLSQDIANNQSTVRITAFWQTKGGSSTFANTMSYTSRKNYYNVNGSTYTQTSATNVSGTTSAVYSAYRDYTFTHDSEGAYSFTLQGSGAVYQKKYYGGAVEWEAWSNRLYASSETYTLPTIARASTVTATNSDIGSATSINVNRASSSFTHTLKYSFGSQSGTIATNVATTYGWTIPTSFYTEIPNALNGTVTITCETYSGSTLIGSKTTTITASVNQTINKPSVSAVIKDTNAVSLALTGNEDILIKYISNANFVMSLSALNSATISSQKITCSDGKQSTASSGTLNSIEDNDFTIQATDSRGITNTTVITPTMVDYVPLTFNVNIFRTQPTNNEVALNFNGNYFSGSFGSQSNTLTMSIRWKETGGSFNSWQSLTPVIVNNTYSNGASDISLGTSFDYQKSYTFEFSVVDKTTTVPKTEYVSEGKPVYWWNKDKFVVEKELYIGNEKVEAGSGVKDGKIGIFDARYEGDKVPNNYDDKSSQITFTDDITSSPNGWDSVLTMKGWADGYTAWQLISNSSNDNSVSHQGLYFRNGIGTSWGSLKPVAVVTYGTSNPPTLADGEIYIKY